MKEAVLNKRAINLGAGPAVLPDEVLNRISDELYSFDGTGMSIMEMSHRSKPFKAVIETAEARLRKLLNIPDEYAVLFLQGGARLQFGMLPMNLYIKGQPIDIIHTGAWTKQALGEAKRLAEVNVAADMADCNFTRLPKPSELKLSGNASYVHLCSNNTIFGTQWKEYPKTDAPLIADMTSDILCRRFDVNHFGAVFASAQKNLGIAGVTVVIIRKDLAERASEAVPAALQYREQIKANSLLNTAPTFPIYVTGLVLEWIESKGGLDAVHEVNLRKAKALYDAVDATGFYTCPVNPDDRSIMNVVFRIKDGDEDLEAAFIKQAEQEGICAIKGHRSVGGLRASIYNAQKEENVNRLIEFMREFEKNNG